MYNYVQRLDPLEGMIFWSRFWSTLLAALPVLVLFWLLVPRRWLAPRAGAAGAVTAIVIAIFVYQMPWEQAGWSFVNGAGFGLLPVGWTVFGAMLLYNITVESGQFSAIRGSVAKLSGDARIQAVLIGFAFGAFLEGSSGAGTPVAICGAILVGLGFNPFLAAVLCLIANTSPVAYGGLGTPLIVLGGVTDIPVETLSIMAGHQLPVLSIIIPAYMVKCMCTWRQTLEVWPVLLVGGGSFALFQLVFATMHKYVPGLVLFPMTDLGGGIFALLAVAIFLRFWRPKVDWHFPVEHSGVAGVCTQTPEHGQGHPLATATPGSEHRPRPRPVAKEDLSLLTPGKILWGWIPYLLMSVLLLSTGLVRQLEERPGRTGEGPGPVTVPFIEPLHTNYRIAIPTLHLAVHRDSRLQETPKPESALFNFAWLTAPGTAVWMAAMLSMLMVRLSWSQIRTVLWRTVRQMRVPIPTIVFMLGLSYVTRYAGMDATLGYAFAGTGVLYPFFAAILGWLGVFLTGTDAGSNALFGSLQKITATTIHTTEGSLLSGALTIDQAQVLICTSNSTGGVMGKMIDAQSICVATAATHQVGREADIFKAVIWHSIILAVIVGLLTIVQAYVWPFTLMVPGY
jgi:lactate permease